MGRTAYDQKLQGQPNRPFPLGNDYEAISDPVGTRIFRSWCCLWRAGNPKLCLGAGNSGQLQIFRFVRFGDGICGLWRGRQNPPLATVIDPLVVRGTCISAMASARPLHYLWDFVMTPKRARRVSVAALNFRLESQGEVRVASLTLLPSNQFQRTDGLLAAIPMTRSG